MNPILNALFLNVEVVGLWNWLKEQGATVTILGIVIFVLYRLFREKDKDLTELAKKQVATFALLEEREKTRKAEDEKYRSQVLDKLEKLKDARNIQN